jgi:hypothetical protein
MHTTEPGEEKNIFMFSNTGITNFDRDGIPNLKNNNLFAQMSTV